MLLVEGLKVNLIGISQICDNKPHVQFTKEECRVLNEKGECVLTERRSTDNYYLLAQELVSFSITTDPIELWH